jgi:hypothetical protein
VLFKYRTAARLGHFENSSADRTRAFVIGSVNHFQKVRVDPFVTKF